MLIETLLSFVVVAQPVPLPKLVGTLSVRGGTVMVARKGVEPIRAGTYLRLREGDTLTASDKAKATVFLDALGEVRRLGETGSWQVRANGFNVLAGTSPTLVSKRPTRRRTTVAQPPIMAGRIRGGTTAVSPVGALTSLPVTVSWTRVAGVRSTIQLLDGTKVLWSRKDLAEASVVVPSERVPAGAWIQVRLIQGSGNVTTSWIRRLPLSEVRELEAEEKQLRQSLSGDPVALGLALGDLFASYALVSRFSEALGLIFVGPEEEKSAAAHWKRGEWLEASRLPGLARMAYEQAWAAGGREPELQAAILRLGGTAEVPEWERLSAERDRLLDELKFAEALPIAQKVVDLLRKEKPNSLSLAWALDWSGLAAFNSRNLADAEAAWSETVAIYERLAPGSLDLARCLFNLGIAARARGDLAVVQRRHEAALAIFEQLAPGSLDVANSLNNLGAVAYDRGDLAEAQLRHEAALAIYERLAPGSLDVARSLSSLGNVAYARGDLDEAQRRYEAALAIREKLAPGSLNVANSLSTLGNVAIGRGNLDEAQHRYEAALAIREKLAPGSLYVADSLNHLGNLASVRGDLDGAQRRHEAALAIREKLAPGSSDTAFSLNGLGNLAWQRGDLARAQRCFESALAILERLAPGSLNVAGPLANLGGVAFDRGDLAEAQRRYEAALAIREKLAPGSFSMASNLVGLGSVAGSRGDLAEAQRQFEAALAILEKLAPGSLDVALTLNNLGIIASVRGDLDGAQRRHEAALAIREKLAPGSLEVANSLNSLGAVTHARGDLAEAQRQFEAALAIREKLAPGSLDVAQSLKNLGVIARRREDNESGRMLTAKRLDVAANLLVGQGTSRPNELGRFAAEANNAMVLAGWLQDPATFYPWLPTLRAAGLTLQSRAKASELAAETDEQVRNARSAVQIAVRQENDWATRPRPAGMEEKVWTDRLLELRAKRQSDELALSALLRAKDPRLAADLKVNLVDIQKAIPADGVLVEYLRVSTWDDKARKEGKDAYGAFIVRSKGDVRFVRLGDAEEIDQMVEEWHLQIAIANDPNAPETTEKETEKALRSLGRKLHDRLIQPLGKLPNTVWLAPDSALHTLPFAALLDRSGKHLVETLSLSVVGSGRDLVEKPITAEPGPIAVIANPEFNASATSLAEAGTSSRSSYNIARAINARGEWSPLPSAAVEGDAVAKLLNAQPIEGAQATEEKLLSLVRPRVLHIATHGFFFPPTVEPNSRDEMLSTDMAGRGLRVADNPMIRSGLVMAGANQDDELRKVGLADGWATALEISLMDLRGTELVVLSACDTGRGDTQGAEGVFGLQRAFRFAGAQSLIVSLFKVPDDSTRALMESFYLSWRPGSAKGSKLVALRGAQRAMLKKPSTRHPRHWSAFVLIGER